MCGNVKKSYWNTKYYIKTSNHIKHILKLNHDQV